MFKQSSFEEEICRTMEKNLVSNQVENIHGFNKLAQAAEYLNAAAEIFEQAEMHDVAAEVTEVLHDLTKALQ